MLNPSDVYVEGGVNELLACWTSRVTKYDASSFYNWEMDNLPLHDLEERTHFLWERLGHPTSSITGMSFIVSGDSTSSCNPLYFVDLSSCLNAIPEVINYPILIEVASFGQLGSLNLSNKIFGPRGSLEIVNRNCGFAGATDLSDNAMSLDVIDDFTLFSLASSVSSLYDASNPSITFDAFNSYLYTNGSFISSSTNRWEDSRYDEAGHYVFTRRVGRDQLGVMTASLSSLTDPWDDTNLGTASKHLQFSRYDEGYRDVNGESMDVYDVSTINEAAGGILLPPSNLTDGTDVHAAVAANLYFNYLDSIKITNCNGPIYIRNFNVDGLKTKENGIEILNSTVNLERTSVSRCKKAGLYAKNSDVNLLRGFVSFRNYNFDSDGNRTGIAWEDKIDTYSLLDSYGAGIYSENSTINFKSTYDRDVENSSEASSLVYTDSNYTGDLPVPSQEALYCLSRNDIGIHAINSVITGGRTELNGSGARGWVDATQLFTEMNTEAGARFEGCDVDFAGRFISYGNYFGIDAFNSNLGFDTFKAYGNQKDAIKLDGCSLKYNNNIYEGYLNQPLFSTAKNSYLQHQVALLNNGAAITAKNSSIEPLYCWDMPSVYQAFYVSGSHGISKDSAEARKNLKPVISLDSSKLDMVHATIYTSDNGNGTGEESCFGEAISARNGSNVYLRGSSKYANKVFGSGDRTVAQQKISGLYATDNSKISIQGPTVIGQFGVGILVDNNSELEICPHRDSESNLLVSSFTLSSQDNHTMVELHSTRACIVANNGSVVTMEDLGSFSSLWPVGNYGSQLNLGNVDYMASTLAGTNSYLTYVSGGFIQLYPNAFISTDIPFSVHSTTLENRSNFYNIGTFNPTNNFYLRNHTNGGTDFDISSVTTGGMCLRALNKSKVNLTNVHFPTGFPQVSSVIYDFNGLDGLDGACSRLHIWNIADDSILRANYLSISGTHPQDSGYCGPSGNWYHASGAPQSTPDTSSLSVLDYYGPDQDSRNLFGDTSIRNFGPFRLYFSVDPLTNYLVDPTTVVSGYVTQVFSQGYNFSGNLSAPGNVEDFYIKAKFQNDLPTSLTLSDTGFYYANNLVHNPDSVKAYLDDSAANTFANAKHNSVGKSNLANAVAIYDPYYNVFGGDSLSEKDYGNGVASVNNFDLKKVN